MKNNNAYLSGHMAEHFSRSGITRLKEEYLVIIFTYTTKLPFRMALSIYTFPFSIEKGQEEKGTTEDEMAGWHHQLDGQSTLGVGDGQGGLACCDSWGDKELDTTGRLN